MTVIPKNKNERYKLNLKKDDIIKLSDGQTATIIKGDESDYKNCYIVQLEDGQIRVVDRKTLTLAPSK